MAGTDEAGKADPPLPAHLAHHQRRPLQEDPEQVWERAGMGAASMGLFLHHNAAPFFGDVASLGTALGYMADSDLLQTEWLGRDALESISASVCVRGLMHSRGPAPPTPSRFRAITRPQWYAVEKDARRHLEDLRHEHRLSGVTNAELTTVLVPLTAKLTRHGKTMVLVPLTLKLTRAGFHKIAYA